MDRRKGYFKRAREYADYYCGLEANKRREVWAGYARETPRDLSPLCWAMAHCLNCRRPWGEHAGDPAKCLFTADSYEPLGWYFVVACMANHDGITDRVTRHRNGETASHWESLCKSQLDYLRAGFGEDKAAAWKTAMHLPYSELARFARKLWDKYGEKPDEAP